MHSCFVYKFISNSGFCTETSEEDQLVTLIWKEKVKNSICEVSALFTYIEMIHTGSPIFVVLMKLCSVCMPRVSYAPSLELVRGNGMCYITMVFGGCCVILCDGSVNRCFRVVIVCSHRLLLFCRSFQFAKLRKSSEVRCWECSMMKVLSLHRDYCTCFE